jgi:hypothetical protein
MRFMLQVRADRDTEAGVLPSRELVAAMGKFNEEMIKAGVLLAADGLQPSANRRGANGRARLHGRINRYGSAGCN